MTVVFLNVREQSHMASDTPSSRTILVATTSRHLASHVDRKLKCVGLSAESVEPVAEAILERLGDLEPGVVVLDALQKEWDSASLAHDVARKSPRAKVVMLAGSANPEVVTKAILAKASDYLLENMPSDEFAKAIAAVIAGKPPNEESVYGRVASLLPVPTGTGKAFRTRTGRRFEIDDAIRQCDQLGLAVDEIANHLGVPVSVVARVTKHSRKILKPSLLSRVAGTLMPDGGVGAPSRRSLLVALALLIVAGAVMRFVSREPRRHEIVGEVTFQGKPLKVGLVRFTPLGQRESARPIVAGEIRDGRYAVKSGHGSDGGTYKVQISGFTGITKQQGPVSDPLGEPLFPDVTRTTTVPCSDHIFNVKCD